MSNSNVISILNGGTKPHRVLQPRRKTSRVKESNSKKIMSDVETKSSSISASRVSEPEYTKRNDFIRNFDDDKMIAKSPRSRPMSPQLRPRPMSPSLTMALPDLQKIQSMPTMEKETVKSPGRVSRSPGRERSPIASPEIKISAKKEVRKIKVGNNDIVIPKAAPLDEDKKSSVMAMSPKSKGSVEREVEDDVKISKVESPKKVEKVESPKKIIVVDPETPKTTFKRRDSDKPASDLLELNVDKSPSPKPSPKIKVEKSILSPEKKKKRDHQNQSRKSGKGFVVEEENDDEEEMRKKEVFKFLTRSPNTTFRDENVEEKRKSESRADKHSKRHVSSRERKRRHKVITDRDSPSPPKRYVEEKRHRHERKRERERSHERRREKVIVDSPRREESDQDEMTSSERVSSQRHERVSSSSQRPKPNFAPGNNHHRYRNHDRYEKVKEQRRRNLEREEFRDIPYTSWSEIDQDESDRRHRRRRRMRIPDDHMLVSTEYGEFIVRRYDDLPPEEQVKHWNTYEILFDKLNNDWNKYKLYFRPPTEGESLTNVAIRYRQASMYVSARSGAVFYKIILYFCWLAVEGALCKFGFKASGYSDSQLELYELYEDSLVKMGEISGFGEGWSPVTKILVISVINIVIFVISAYMTGSGQKARSMMKMVGKFLVGGENPMVNTDNEYGAPEPVDPSSVMGDTFGGIGEAMGMGGGGFDFTKMFSGMATMFTGNMERNANNKGKQASAEKTQSSNRRERRHANPSYL